MGQTSVIHDPLIAVAGQLARGSGHARSCIAAEAGIVPGDFVLRGTSQDYVRKVIAAAAADPDGWSAVLASAGTVQRITTFGGALGTTRQVPPRSVQLVRSSHENWDLSTWQFTYLDERGNTKTLNLVTPNAGGDTVESLEEDICVPVALDIPAQGGASGTATLGTGNRKGAISGRDLVGIAGYDPGLVGASFADDAVISVWRRGVIAVQCEDAATEGGIVYCRVIAGVGERLGSVRATPDGSAGNPDCVPVLGARFVSTTTGAGIALVELDLVG